MHVAVPGVAAVARLAVVPAHGQLGGSAGHVVAVVRGLAEVVAGLVVAAHSGLAVAGVERVVEVAWLAAEHVASAGVVAGHAHVVVPAAAGATSAPIWIDPVSRFGAPGQQMPDRRFQEERTRQQYHRFQLLSSEMPSSLIAFVRLLLEQASGSHISCTADCIA